MVKEYYLSCNVGFYKQIWIKVDSFLFESFYFNDLYCKKVFTCVRNGFKRDYYTFYKQRSNGLAKPNSTVKFMVFYATN